MRFTVQPLCCHIEEGFKMSRCKKNWSVGVFVASRIDRVCDAARDAGFIVGRVRGLADGAGEVSLLAPDLQTICVRVGLKQSHLYAADFRTRFDVACSRGWVSLDWFISKLPDIRAGHYVVDVSRHESPCCLLLKAVGKTVIRGSVKTVYLLSR
jgi:hypothetical protein